MGGGVRFQFFIIKMSQLPRHSRFTHIFSVSIQDQEFIMFFSGCLHLSANFLIGNMLVVRNFQESRIASHLKGLHSFFN